MGRTDGKRVVDRTIPPNRLPPFIAASINVADSVALRRGKG